MRLRWADIADHVPSSHGTVYVKHCPGQRAKGMGITRFRDGTIKAHCFRCGAKGIWESKGRDIAYILDSLKGLRDMAQSRIVKLPEDYTRDLKQWEPLAAAWISKYDITQAEVERYGLGYSASYRSVVLPCYDAGRLLGVQYRRMVREENEPKYISLRRGGSIYNYCTHVVHHDTRQRHIFVVEDTLSAIKCTRVADAIAILGSSLSDAVVTRIKDYETFVLYLDNDNNQVLRNRTKIAARLRNFGKVVVVRDIVDPKERSTEELRELLHG